VFISDVYHLTNLDNHHSGRYGVQILHTNKPCRTLACKLNIIPPQGHSSGQPHLKWTGHHETKSFCPLSNPSSYSVTQSNQILHSGWEGFKGTTARPTWGIQWDRLVTVKYLTSLFCKEITMTAHLV